jgi:hypothetical protein
MNSGTQRIIGLALLATSLACSAWGQATGGAFRIVGNAVGGGGISAGGPYTLRGAVAQGGVGRSTSMVEPGSGTVDYRLIGGWLGPMTVPVPPRPTMRVRFTDDKLAELTWDQDISGWVLEFSPAIGPGADWQPVVPQPVGSSFTTPCAQPARYFRLRSL